MQCPPAILNPPVPWWRILSTMSGVTWNVSRTFLSSSRPFAIHSMSTIASSPSIRAVTLAYRMADSAR
jgi:hypothetical protein